MRMERDERFTRLPMWARREIKYLDLELAYMEKRLDAALAARGFAVDGYSLVPDGESRVRFPLASGGWIDVDYVEEEDSTLAIRGNARISVQPQAANALMVRVEQ